MDTGHIIIPGWGRKATTIILLYEALKSLHPFSSLLLHCKLERMTVVLVQMHDSLVYRLRTRVEREDRSGRALWLFDLIVKAGEVFLRHTA